MAARRQTQVIAELKRTADRALGKAAKHYRRDVIDPLLAGIRTAKSPEGLLQQLGPGLVRKMDTASVADAMTEAAVTATGVGMVSAMPKEGAKRRRDRE